MSKPSRFRKGSAGLEFSRAPGSEHRVVEVRRCSLLAYCSEEDHGLPKRELLDTFEAGACKWRGEHIRDCESG